MLLALTPGTDLPFGSPYRSVTAKAVKSIPWRWLISWRHTWRNTNISGSTKKTDAEEEPHDSTKKWEAIVGEAEKLLRMTMFSFPSREAEIHHCMLQSLLTPTLETGRRRPSCSWAHFHIGACLSWSWLLMRNPWAP